MGAEPSPRAKSNDRRRKDYDTVHANALAWERRQDRRVLTAIHRAFCHHHGHGADSSATHTCLRPCDRRVIAEWSERIVRTALGLPVPEIPPCWFPGCTRGAHHSGQHSGITTAGRRLAELEAALAEGLLVWRTG